MQAEFDRFWGDRWPLHRMVELSGAWAPLAGVYEQNGSIVIKAELPGVKKEDIDVDVEHDHLVIRGERKEEEKVEEKDYYRMERSLGRFYRRLPLPRGVRHKRIQATFAGGVLQVMVPKPTISEPAPAKVTIT